jgi:competence protein ComEA
MMKKLYQTFNVRSLRLGVLALALGSMMVFSAPSYAVNINSATVEILQNVKGIGPTRAKAIVEEREKNGPFVNSEDLNIRVKGIGQKTAEKMTESGLTFDGVEPLTRSKSAKVK